MKDEIRRAGLVTVVILVATFAGCRGDGVAPTGNAETAPAGNSASIRPMRVVTDDLGREITIPVKITRVVSLAPSVTENIFAVGAGDRLVGVTTFCNYPEEAKAIAKVGDTLTPNMETIIALKPDVVFVSTASQIEAFMKTLEANGIAVYVTNPTSLEGVWLSMLKLGEVLGTSAFAESEVKKMKGRETHVLCGIHGMPCGLDLAKPTTPAADVSVFVQISREPLFTIGRESFLNSVIAVAGGNSLTAEIETAYPKLSKETASALNPDAIILSESDDNKEPNEVFKNSSAVKNGRVYKINADILSRPGPRLVDALEQIAKDLHPEKFN